jgi:UDP-N-acetylmuramoyl-L-alanyl-D-glutamate--2,6-diaminopimelate ligase
MKLSDILAKVGHLRVRGNTDRLVSGIAYDSRKVAADGLFVAIPGAKHDGYEYLEEAVKHGAGVVVLTHGHFSRREVTEVHVEDARRALAEMADVFHGHPSGRLAVAGITGTNGKTTTAFMLRNVLEAAGLAPGLMGTVQYEIGARILPATRTTPEASDIQGYFDQMLRSGCRGAVMEVSSHALSQDRVRGIDFDVAVFTNLTRDHLDYHETMEAYYQAKRRLFTTLGGGGKPAVAVINHDDPWGRRLAADPDIKVPVLTFGLAGGAAVRATEVAMGPSGSDFTVRGPWGDSRLHIPLLGGFNLQNGLAAYTAARALGVEEGVVVRALAGRTAVPGRLEEIPTRRGYRVFVDYAHTDDALANVLETLRAFTEGRLIVVFGCGGNRDRCKRALMGAVAARLANQSILTSDNPRDEVPAAIIEEIRAGFGDKTNYAVVEDRAGAIHQALAMAGDKDVILIAGKGHETTQERQGVYSLFDDRQMVRKILKEMDGTR